MSCCDPIKVRQEHRYGVITSKLHAPECPYGAGLPYRGDLTPREPSPILHTFGVNTALTHWKEAPANHDCDMCRYIEAHLDDDDDYRESIVDSSDDEVVPT